MKENNEGNDVGNGALCFCIPLFSDYVLLIVCESFFLTFELSESAILFTFLKKIRSIKSAKKLFCIQKNKCFDISFEKIRNQNKNMF